MAKLKPKSISGRIGGLKPKLRRKGVHRSHLIRTATSYLCVYCQRQVAKRVESDAYSKRHYEN